MVSIIEKTILYYNSLARGYKELYWKEQESKIRTINNFYNLNKIQNKHILDCGAADGILNKFLDLRKNKLYSIDISFKMLLKNTNTKKIVADICKMPFKDKTFDIIISITVLQDIGEYNKAITEIKRVLKKKGILILSILKRSSKLEDIKDIIKKNLNIIKEIEEKKDLIIFCEKSK